MRSRYVLLIVFLLCSNASAGLFGIRWKDNPASAEYFVGPSGATVEVWVDLLPGENLVGVNFAFEDVAPNLELTEVRPTLDGWRHTDFPGILDPSVDFPYISIFAEIPPATVLDDPGQHVIGEFDLIAVGTTFTSPQFVTTTVHNNAGVGIIGNDAENHTALFYTWDARYAATYSGYFAYGGYGNPGWSNAKGAQKGQPTPNPLIANLTPEPSSLVIIALGGLAMLKRYRAT